MTDLQDAEARRRILTDFDTTFFVEAAAGTGKTSVLIGRIVALIREGVSTLDRVVAVTFTEKAAGEMKLRLRTEIESARQDAATEEQRRLERALSELELARIGTIHAFCGDLLRERLVAKGGGEDHSVALRDEIALNIGHVRRLGDRLDKAGLDSLLFDALTPLIMSIAPACIANWADIDECCGGVGCRCQVDRGEQENQCAKRSQ